MPSAETAQGSRVGTNVAPHLLRRALRCHPEGVCVITTRDTFGYELGLTATAVSSVSLSPALLLVCIDNRSILLGPMRAGAHFIVHFLSGDQEHVARHFAQRMLDKFDGAHYTLSTRGCPRLHGALASIECVPHEVLGGGDHTIVIGRALDVRIDESCHSALAFFDGGLRRLRRLRSESQDGG